MQGRGDESAPAEVTCQQEAALEAEGVTQEREARERGMSEAHDDSSLVGEIRVASAEGAWVANDDRSRWWRLDLHQGGWRRGRAG
jgi:hypothetical protein